MHINLKRKIKYIVSVSAVSIVSMHYANAQPEYNETNRNIIVNPQEVTFQIKLQSNPTTGYAWFLRKYDSTIIQPVKRKYVGLNQKAVGSGGYEIWTFSVKKSGFVVPQQTTISMSYTRPWEIVGDSSQVIFHISTTDK